MRETVIKHYLNGDSERQIATKMLIPRSSINSIITKYKKTKCIGNILGRGRKRKTSVNVDRIIQRKIKVDRRKSAPSVKVELQSKHGITISEQRYVDDYTKSVFLVVLLEKNHMSIRLIVVNVLHSPKHIGRNLLASGITSCGQMKANLTYLDQMGKLWFGECQKKSSIQNALFQL